MRTALLNKKKITLLGERPSSLTKIKPFIIHPALNTKNRRTSSQLKKGNVIISTLPNIKSNACINQIYDISNIINKRKLPIKVFNVSSDSPNNWVTVDKLHHDLHAKGYTIYNASEESINNFKETFGIGVLESQRIAHGLFGLKNGKIIHSMIPRQQMGNPDARKFLREYCKKARIKTPY